MIRPIDIRLNAAHPNLPLAEAVTYTGAPSSVFIRGVPRSCGTWSITAVSVAVTFPDNTTTTRAAVESADGVWVATIPGTATSGRTASGFRILADGVDENGAAVTGYVLGFADFSVLSFTPVPAPGGTFWLLRYFDAIPAAPKKGDVSVVGGVLKYYNGSAWTPFADLTNYYTRAETDDAIDRAAAYYITYNAQGANFPTRAALINATAYYSGGAPRVPTRNDYAVVLADEEHQGAEWRYIYAVPVGQTTGQWEAQYPIETNDYDALANKPSINGVTLSGNKTAALLGLATTADATLTERGYSEWSILHTPLTAEQKAAFYEEAQRAAQNDYAVTISPGPAAGLRLYVGEYYAAELSVSVDGLAASFYSGSPEAQIVWGPAGTTVATRVALSGYQLGSQDDKPLASEAEAEALRTVKRDKTDLSINPDFWVLVKPDETKVKLDWNATLGLWERFGEGALQFANGYWVLGVGETILDELEAPADSARLVFENGTDVYRLYRATEIATNADLAKGLEAKQNALTAQQLANIAAVSNALAFDATHSYAAGDPVVYNGTLYTFTAAHTGAWTWSDVSAVDIIARLAGKLDKSDETWNVSYTDSGLRIADAVGMYYLDISPSGVKTNFPNAAHEVFWPINGGTTALLENLTGNFSSSTAYAKDALVVYSSALYRCVNPNGHTGAWVAADFAMATIEDVLAALRTSLDLKAPLASPAFTGTPTAPTPTAGDDSTKVATTAFVQDGVRYNLGAATTISTASQDTSGTETIDYGAATMADRTANLVQITTALDELRITFPAATSGKVRDFELRVEVGTGSAALTAPALVAVAPTGETITHENPDGSMPAIADGTASAKGVTVLYFSETAAGKFLCKGEEVKAIS